MENVTSVILGGGQGTRLAPLTLVRAKPAVSFAGKYRLIDIPISNSINSGIKRVFVLTQFMSASLHRHIMKTYHFDTFSNDFVEILAAQQTFERSAWFQGTADAVRATLNYTTYYKSEQVLILSGDHLYRMNYRDCIKFHCEKEADITVCVSPVTRDEAPDMGLLKIDENGRVIEFVEKPREASVLDEHRAPKKLLRDLGFDTGSDRYLASMGVYVFRPDTLVEALAEQEQTDFGKEVIPSSIKRFRVVAYPFTDYWRDIGTIQAFYEANIELAQRNPPFPLYRARWPIYTHTRSLPPSRVIRSEIRDSLIVEGSDILGARITDSIIGLRSNIREGANLKDVILMGADFYEGEEDLGSWGDKYRDLPPLGIGRNCFIERAIIDKNVRIGDNVIIRARPDAPDFESDTYWKRDGITIIPKWSTIPAGTEL